MIIDNYSLDNFERVLNEYALEFEAVYKKNLQKGDWKASGNLINSVHCSINVNGKIVSVQMSVADYWKWVEVGRGPTKNGGSGVLKNAIYKWIQDKGIEPRDTSNIPREKKLQRMSYAISRSIHQKGWKKQATDKPYATSLEEVNAKYLPKIEAALKEDTEKIITIIWNNVF